MAKEDVQTLDVHPQDSAQWNEKHPDNGVAGEALEPLLRLGGLTFCVSRYCND